VQRTLRHKTLSLKIMKGIHEKKDSGLEVTQLVWDLHTFRSECLPQVVY
jgi:hypothetical protein